MRYFVTFTLYSKDKLNVAFETDDLDLAYVKAGELIEIIRNSDVGEVFIFDGDLGENIESWDFNLI